MSKSDLEKLAESFGVALVIRASHGLQRDTSGWEHYAYDVRIMRMTGNPDHAGGRGSQVIDSPYRAGTAHKDPPSLADVLYSLLLDASTYDSARSFEEWASDLGYDSDSRKAFTAYEACKRTSERLHKMFADSELETLHSAAADM